MSGRRTLHVKADGPAGADFSYSRPGGLDAALELVAAGRGGATVYLHPGVYRLSQALRLGPEFSDVEFRALGEGVALDGGRPLVDWRRVERGGKALWAAPAPEGMRFLYIDGRRRQLCRFPAGAPLKAEISESRASCALPAELAGLENLELTLDYDWICRRLKVAKVDAAGADFVPDQIRPTKSANLWLENLPPDFLSPGQWALADGLVHYLPEEDGEFTAWAGGLPTLLEVEGGVEGLVFDGVEFRHTGDARLVNSSQAEWACSAAVRMSGARGCRFENCAFTRTSGWGLALEDGCRDIVVTHCRFEDLGAGGVSVNGSTQPGGPGETRDNRVTHNVLRDGGRHWHSAVAVLTRHSAGNLIANNEISRFHYSGISCGWVWGYADNISRDNLILDNHIHHLGEDKLLVDMGGIYTLGAQPGSVIRGNHIHHLDADLICWGIYLDEGSSGFLVERNLVHHVRSECFHIHYGRDNTARDNVFGFGGPEGVCSVTRGTMDRDQKFVRGDVAMRLTGNVMVSAGAPFITKYILDYAEKEDLSCVESDRNLLQSAAPVPVMVADGFHMFEHSYQVALGEAELRELGRLEANSKFVNSPGPLPPELLDGAVASLYQRLWTGA